ncbi:SDR family NAD(P)-dependent oxidoreductase [Actinokineospora bangkokensis]|uniref:Short-chain dehydrogenase n=1 Tax=Actinokineospora bangkokensis TaxID=1193682 RepID=A0A1Q9LLU0_9PSEU|nr:SDR family NAD(P)-dependent oxidoreductase [Actinokineospora bangkokensis]OLR93007.1 short-chain dehydrogenase [Actinokineospora bangkokensis]
MNSTPIALVTGANRGIGLEVAAQLATDHAVLLAARDARKAEQAAAALAGRGVEVTPLVLDVTSPGSIAAAAARVDRLDVLVNNAAVHYDTWQGAVDADLGVVVEALETNLLGPWRVTQAFLPALRQGRGRVVNVSSEAGSVAAFSPGVPAYRVTKTALNTLTRLFAAELAEDGVSVLAACPGWTATEMGGEGGRPVPEGAASVVAAVRAEGGSGGFFRDGAPLAW